MQYPNLLTKAILSLILACGYVATLQAAHAPRECEKVGELCGPPPGGTQPSKTINAEDITIQYRYGGPNGQKDELSNHGKLRTGDRFTIHITPKRNMYLYLFHFGTTNKVTELLEAFGRNNHLAPGTTLILPSETKHFEMDSHTGTETIYAVVSVKPLLTLTTLYRHTILKLDMLPPKSTGKDFFSRDNPKQLRQDDITEGAYRDIMKIDHIAQ